MHQLVQFDPDARAEQREFEAEVLRGLSLPQKALPSRFFYDARGSALFEEITRLPEYYLTRVETGLLKAIGPELYGLVPKGAAVVEFGSGSSRKTELLLRTLDAPSAYVPIDISAAALFPAARRIERRFPRLGVHPVLGSFHELQSVNLPVRDRFCLGFFPGSTIGNLTRGEAVDFLRSARKLLGEKAAFLIGADLDKSLDLLLPAYDDSRGVTAAFNLNLLARINGELDGTFDLKSFRHRASYCPKHSRVEMHLQSLREQKVSVSGRCFRFKEGETIHTENSHKYTVSAFHELAREGGWQPARTWLDKDDLFSLHLLISMGGNAKS